MHNKMEITTSQTAPKRTKLRWYQYSLRTLLIIVTLFACLCSWFTVKLHQAKIQREAVEKIEKARGIVFYDYQVDEDGYVVRSGTLPIDVWDETDCNKNLKPPGPVWLVNLLGKDFFSAPVNVVAHTDAALEHIDVLRNIRCLELSDDVTDSELIKIEGLTKLRRLSLNNAKITDLGFEHLRHLFQLEELSINGGGITDAGLENLKGLTQLLDLEIYDNLITDKGLKHLKGLNQLERLEIMYGHVTDAGLGQLQNLSQLTSLGLIRTQITDAGLMHLKGLTKLSSLNLSETKITDAGLDEIKWLLPQLISLDIDGTEVTDAGMEKLKVMSQVESLNISNTKVSDAGLQCLFGLKDLRNVDLQEVECSDETLKKLELALPKCYFQFMGIP
jgi:Leucine-rich repeat (LRR) protein